MREYNLYKARVAECEERAKTALNEAEKQSWLAMADNWRETAELQEMLSESSRSGQFVAKFLCNGTSGTLVGYKPKIELFDQGRPLCLDRG